MNKKGGELYIISLFVCGMFCILFLFISLVSYFQINSILTGVKDSIFTISQNAIMAYNKEYLPYDVYDINMEQLGKIMNELLYKNHIEGKNKIQKIDTKELYLITNVDECVVHTNGKFNNTILHIKLEITFVPIIKTSSEKTIIIHEDVKLALMKY